MGELGQRNDALEQRARDAYRALLQQQGPREVPSEDQIVDLVLGRLTSEERDRVADAIVASPDLARDVRDLMAIHLESRRELATPTTAPSAKWYWFAAAAAVVILAVGVTPMILRSGPPGAAIRNGVATPALETRPADGAVLAVAPETLSWTAAPPEMPEGASFRVVLYDYESTVLWQSEETAGSAVGLPDRIRREMQPGQDYFWRVNVRSGLDEGRSSLLRFQIAP